MCTVVTQQANEVIIKSGYASVMTYPPNVKYKDKFIKKEPFKLKQDESSA